MVEDNKQRKKRFKLKIYLQHLIVITEKKQSVFSTEILIPTWIKLFIQTNIDIWWKTSRNKTPNILVVVKIVVALMQKLKLKKKLFQRGASVVVGQLVWNSGNNNFP